MLRVHLAFLWLALALTLGLAGCGASGPTAFPKSERPALACAPSAAPFCERSFTALNPEPPFTRAQGVAQGSAFDPERAEGF